MEITVSSNAALVARDLVTVTVATQQAVRSTVRSQGALFRTKVQARASGRPGPRAQTGDYRRSIGEQTTETATSIRSEVGTNSPQGRRLENGFWGLVDSLGRLYHQPAYPHFEPAADEMEHVFPVAIERAVTVALGGTGR